jgi:AraC-like DNA-binding protein
MIAAAAVSLPFAWADRAKSGPLFRAALAIMFALWSFAAVISQLMPGGGAGQAIEPGAMALAGAFMFSALEAAGPRRRFSPLVFTGAGLIALAAVFPTFSGGFERWDSVGACFWTSCTVSGFYLYTIRGGQWRKARQEERLVLAAALSFATVNLAQVVRMSVHGPGAEIIILVTVPVVLALMGVLASTRLALQFATLPPRYEKSGLSDTAADDLFRRIEHLMAHAKPFTDPELDREGLAALLGADARAVGEAVNRAGGTSLAGYLRRKRLAEADKLLAAPENARVSLEALGLQAGFRSRSRFYAAFEEAYGETPGARRERLQQAETLSRRSGTDTNTARQPAGRSL